MTDTVNMKRTRGNLTSKVDRDALHRFLWERRGRNDVVLYSQKELAEGLGITQATICIIFREMRETGRLQRVGPKYRVTDPELHEWKHTPERTLFS